MGVSLWGFVVVVGLLCGVVVVCLGCFCLLVGVVVGMVLGELEAGLTLASVITIVKSLKHLNVGLDGRAGPVSDVDGMLLSIRTV